MKQVVSLLGVLKEKFPGRKCSINFTEAEDLEHAYEVHLTAVMPGSRSKPSIYGRMLFTSEAFTQSESLKEEFAATIAKMENYK